VALTHDVQKQAPHTVTLAFETLRGTPADEAPDAERFAAALGSPHVTHVVTRGEFVDDLPRFFDAMDQPTIDGTNTWFVSKAAAARGLKVAISGLGGDELFGSYPSFRDVPRIVRASRVPGIGRLARALSHNPKTRSIAQGRTYGMAYMLKRGLFLPDELPSVLGKDAAEEGLRRLDPLCRVESQLEPDPLTPFGRVAALEASLYMRNQLLRDTDWASMAHSLEVRTPLVDASLLRQISPLLLVEGSKCKQFFAVSPRPPLPEWIRLRRKSGFAVPLAAWMKLESDGTSTRMRSWSKVVFDRYAASVS